MEEPIQPYSIFYLYIAILLVFRSLRDALSNDKNVYQSQPQAKW